MDVDKLLRTAPVKDEFGPTLPQLLAPRIDSLPPIALRVIAVGALLVAAAVILLALRLRDPVFSSAGPPAFSTSYPRSMTQRADRRGALLLLEQHSSVGLEASFEISPLACPPTAARSAACCR